MEIYKMENRAVALLFALMAIFLAGVGCENRKPSGATIPIVVSQSTSISAKPINAGSKTIPITDLLIRAEATASKSIVANLLTNDGLRAIPGNAKELAVVEWGHGQFDNHRADSIHVEQLGGDSYEIKRSDRNYERWLCSMACGAAQVGGKPDVRIVTLIGHNNRDPNSELSNMLGKLSGVKLRATHSLQSMLLGMNAEVECTREFRDIGVEDVPISGSHITLIALADCDSDGQDDFLLVIQFGKFDKRKTIGVLLSGNKLQTIAPLPMSEMLGSYACEIPDIDGDGFQDVFVTGETEKEYFLISPKTRKVIQRVALIPSGGDAAYLREVCSAGTTAQGDPIMAVAFSTADAPRVDQIAVINVLTGLPLSPAFPLSEDVYRMVSGRIRGDNRRWLAFTTWNTARSGDPMHLFVEELGVTGSTVEVLLPVDGRDYAVGCCAVAVPGSTHDCLAITVSPTEATDGATIDFGPVMFLDVTRCFDRH